MAAHGLSFTEHQPPRADVLITVAICTRNRAKLLQKAIISVLPQLTPRTEILVVDNGSTDETQRVLADFSAKCGVLRHCVEAAPGVSAARNRAINEARGKYVLFLDDDAIAQENWLAAYVRFFSCADRSRVACVGGPVFPCFDKPPPRWLSPRFNVLDYGGPERELIDGTTPWGGNVAYDKSAVLKTGAFNLYLGRQGAFLGAHEETDMNQRLQQAGWQIWWLPDAKIDHLVPAAKTNFRGILRLKFDGGRSSAMLRLRDLHGSCTRASYRLVRLLSAPLHVSACAAAALVAFFVGARRSAAKFCFQAARIAGFHYQLLQP